MQINPFEILDLVTEATVANKAVLANTRLCRKCVAQADLAKDRCSYCNLEFVYVCKPELTVVNSN